MRDWKVENISERQKILKCSLFCPQFKQNLELRISGCVPGPLLIDAYRPHGLLSLVSVVVNALRARFRYENLQGILHLKNSIANFLNVYLFRCHKTAIRNQKQQQQE